MLELNLGSIEKFRFFGDRIAFFSNQLRKLGIKLHKPEIRDQSEQNTQFSTL